MHRTQLAETAAIIFPNRLIGERMERLHPDMFHALEFRLGFHGHALVESQIGYLFIRPDGGEGSQGMRLAGAGVRLDDQIAFLSDFF